MHWRRFPVSSIPITDPESFDLWLRDRWTEKDNLLEYFVQNGRFPEDGDDSTDDIEATHFKVTVGGQDRLLKSIGGSNSNGKWEGPVETEVKLAHWWDVVDMFTVFMWVSPYYCVSLWRCVFR